MATGANGSAAAANAAPIVKNAGYSLLEDIKSEFLEMHSNGGKMKRLVVMIGGADFFQQGGRTDPYELIALVKYLKSINAHTPSDDAEITEVLAFDEAYTYKSKHNDIAQLNKSIYNERKLNGVTKESFSSDVSTYPNEYLQEGLLGAVHFQFIAWNLATKYKEMASPQTFYPFLNGKTSVKTMADQCVPKEGSLMKAIQEICTEVPFEEFYLYNCAWIHGTQFYRNNTTGKIKVGTAKQNRLFENMCELLYIFQRTGKPTYLLTAKDMSVFEHPAKKKGLPYNSLNATPLNDTTMFIKEEWANSKIKMGGKSVRKTRKRKGTRKDRNAL